MAEKLNTVAEAKNTEDEAYIVEYIQKCRKEAMDAAKSRREAWKELWNAYQNKQDNRFKEAWQSKMFAPKVWMKVEKAAAEVKRALLQMNKLFKFAIDDEQELEDEQKEQLLEEMPRIEARFKRALEKSNLANVYAEMSKASFLLGKGVPKALWDFEKEGLSYQNIQALDTHISPDYKIYEDERPPYLVEDQEMNLANFKAMAEKVNKAAGTEIYKTKVLDDLEEDFREVERQQEKQKQLGMGRYKEVSKRVYLWQFWGDIIYDDGELEENVLCVVVNKKYLVRKQSNPFDHRKTPYVVTFPLPYPHRGIAGCSLVEPTVRILNTYNNLLNMYVDNMNFSVNKCFEYDPNKLLNPKSVKTMYPGKTLETTGSEYPVVKEVPVTPVGKDAISGLEVLDREMQEATSVTEFNQAMPSKKTKTLGEIEIKTAESRGLFDTIARDMEQNSIKPLLEMSYSLLVQFSDFEPIEGKYIIKVGGLSLLLMQKEQGEQIQQVIGMAAKVPQLAQMTDIGQLWNKFLGLLNLQDAYIDEDDREVDPAMIEQKAQLDARKAVEQMSPEQIMRANLKRAG
jgi:hypothetical protein